MADSFQCTLVTPEEELLDERVTYASVPGWDGLLGVAPMHAPLLLKLGDGALRLDFQQGGSRWFFVGGGFAQMIDNKLTLLTAEAVPAETIVRKDVEAAMKESEARVALSDEDVARKGREINRGRVMLELLEHINNGI